jgi:AcrR family transcriptional regulator
VARPTEGGIVARPLRADARRNRDRLLDVASDAFAEYGVEASLEEIARQAGVGIGTLYRHYPSRDALVEAVFRRSVDQLVDAATELLETMPPEQALSEWMRRFVALVAAKKGLATHLKSVLSEDSALFAYSQERMNSAMQRLVEAAAASGAVRPDIAPADLLSALSGACLMSDGPGWQDQACRITALLMDGLRYQPEVQPLPNASRRNI